MRLQSHVARDCATSTVMYLCAGSLRGCRASRECIFSEYVREYSIECMNSCQKLAATTPVNVRMLATTNVHIRASVGAMVDLASERTPRPVECATREGE